MDNFILYMTAESILSSSSFITSFSYSLLDDLQVRSMPGVVIVESLGQGHILLHAAPDKSTRHIADLVSKQFDPYRYIMF